MHVEAAKFKPLTLPKRHHGWVVLAMIAVFLVVVLW